MAAISGQTSSCWEKKRFFETDIHTLEQQKKLFFKNMNITNIQCYTITETLLFSITGCSTVPLYVSDKTGHNQVEIMDKG
jgi:hypothetical protein